MGDAQKGILSPVAGPPLHCPLGDAPSVAWQPNFKSFVRKH
jgi:hypothetical protein